MVLGEGELEGRFQPGFRLGPAAEPEQGLAEQDSWHHPFRFLLRTKGEVTDCLGGLAFGEERLGEAETKQLVARLLGDERGKVGGTGGRSVSHG